MPQIDEAFWDKGAPFSALFLTEINFLCSDPKKAPKKAFKLVSLFFSVATNRLSIMTVIWVQPDCAERRADCADEEREQSGPSKLNAERHHGQLGLIQVCQLARSHVHWLRSPAQRITKLDRHRVKLSSSTHYAQNWLERCFLIITVLEINPWWCHNGQWYP